MNDNRKTSQQPRRVLFLMSDTGGGHRSAAEAIEAAIHDRYPGAYTCEAVDVFKDYTPFPFKYLPAFYPIWVHHSKRTWHLGYMLTDARRRSKIVLDSFHLTWRGGVRRLFETHDADVIVSVHSMFSRPALRTLNNQDEPRPPFITVVTDLVSTHAFWYENRTDLCLVPTMEAYERGLKYGMQANKMKITGLPVHPRFVKGLMPTHEARAALNWHQDKLTVLMVSGGQGVGPVYETARAIDERRLDIQLVIVAGSNENLKAQLEACDWNQPTRVYGFVTEMAKFMAAADILITKAGPASVSEACVAGLPMIISDYIPGQEDGNVRYVVENEAGVYAPGPQKVADALVTWVNEPPSMRQRYAHNAAKLGRPDAAWNIAEEVHHLAQITGHARATTQHNTEDTGHETARMFPWSVGPIYPDKKYF